MLAEHLSRSGTILENTGGSDHEMTPIMNLLTGLGVLGLEVPNTLLVIPPSLSDSVV